MVEDLESIMALALQKKSEKSKKISNPTRESAKPIRSGFGTIRLAARGYHGKWCSTGRQRDTLYFRERLLSGSVGRLVWQTPYTLTLVAQDYTGRPDNPERLHRESLVDRNWLLV